MDVCQHIEIALLHISGLVDNTRERNELGRDVVCIFGRFCDEVLSNIKPLSNEPIELLVRHGTGCRPELVVELRERSARILSCKASTHVRHAVILCVEPNKATHAGSISAIPVGLLLKKKNGARRCSTRTPLVGQRGSMHGVPPLRALRIAPEPAA